VATERILKVTIAAVSMPASFAARVAARYQLWGLQSDLKRCETVVDEYGESVPRPFIDALAVAEDHRNSIHYGVDPIGILRASVVRILSGHKQGASTIEQQLVRVVTGRYEKTIVRKLREQALALLLSRTRAKQAIASAYLSVAFYGSSCVGLKGLWQMCGRDLNGVEADKILQAVAQLKYPRPTKPTIRWHMTIKRRIEYLRARKVKNANNVFKPTPEIKPVQVCSFRGGV